MINSICLYLNAGSDAEVRQAGQKSVAGFRGALSQGRDKPSVWFDVDAWSDNRFAFEDVSRIRKGDRVTVQGRLTMREYQSKTGETVQRLGLTVDRIAGAPRQDRGGYQRAPQRQPEPQQRGGYGRDNHDDTDIPF